MLYIVLSYTSYKDGKIVHMVRLMATAQHNATLIKDQQDC